MQKIAAITQRISNGLPSISATTTSPREPSARIGMQAGGRGLQTTPSSLPSVETALRGSNPDTTDRSLEASLTSLIGSKPVPVWEDKITETGGWDGVVSGFKLPAMSETKRASALALAESSLRPMSASECIDLLVELKLLTKARPEQARDQEAQLLLYGKKLAEYPADIVRRVLTTQPNILMWWPSWAELKERLDLFSARRQRLLDALKNPPAPKQSTEAWKPPVLPDAVQKIVDEKRARQAEAKAMVEPTPEEMERRRLELLAMCES
jgi:hypothetical protein